ncbi:hypothetical protein TSAR_000508 [Trichomalopsis sarcophagae]|uniref:Uncharacterized protein n=1 Tax=Trichomalopsis sarcophagae TaxID=543379 RepID=A0A232ELE1_9HYME|nr:hypothetical protein TSAR_000508 [Trichomalopsis sarcophagae]
MTLKCRLNKNCENIVNKSLDTKNLGQKLSRRVYSVVMRTFLHCKY